MTSMSSTSWMWAWWFVIVAINLVQVATCVYLYRGSLQAPDARDPYVKWMRIMGLVFTLVALYRSVFVSRYLFQYAWFDTMLNSSLLIRTFACFAEISFSCLIAFTMLRFNQDVPAMRRPSYPGGSFVRRKSPYILIASIALAQLFAATGLITKSRLAFAIEETLWSVGFLAILPLAIVQARHVIRSRNEFAHPRLAMLRASSLVVLGWCIIYCTYGLIYHLPAEYWATALDQMKTGVPAMKSGVTAIADAFRIVNVTHNYQDWGFGFIFWHTCYFTVCVWLALFLMRAPRQKP